MSVRRLVLRFLAARLRDDALEDLIAMARHPSDQELLAFCSDRSYPQKDRIKSHILECSICRAKAEAFQKALQPWDWNQPVPKEKVAPYLQLLKQAERQDLQSKNGSPNGADPLHKGRRATTLHRIAKGIQRLSQKVPGLRLPSYAAL